MQSLLLFGLVFTVANSLHELLAPCIHRPTSLHTYLNIYLVSLRINNLNGPKDDLAIRQLQLILQECGMGLIQMLMLEIIKTN